MSSKKEAITDEETELNHAYQLGIATGLQQASGLLMQKAIACFESGPINDEIASRYRSLSMELDKLSDEARHKNKRK